jgi:nicotinamide riboside transporter PnuC
MKPKYYVIYFFIVSSVILLLKAAVENNLLFVVMNIVNLILWSIIHKTEKNKDAKVRK